MEQDIIENVSAAYLEFMITLCFNEKPILFTKDVALSFLLQNWSISIIAVLYQVIGI